MQYRKLIQIQDDPQEIYYFLYKDKRYPFNMDIFKISSKYFSNNPEKIQPDHTINLIDESSKFNNIFTEESINNFIQYSQRQQIYLTNENAVALNYLSKKYEIDSLIEITDQYIEEFRKDLILQLVSVYQDEETFCTAKYETLISDNLESYIKDDLMLTLNIPIIYRILSNFESKQKQAETNKLDREIVDFFFKCLTKYGKCASILFSFIDVTKLSPDEVNLLYNEYSDILDFHFINSSFLKTIYEYQIDLSQKEEQNQKLEIEISQLKDNLAIENENRKKNKIEIEQLKQENEQMKNNLEIENENKKKNEIEIEQLKQENEQIKNNLSIEHENKKKDENEIAQLKQENEQMKDNLETEKENKEQNENEITQLKQKIENLKMFYSPEKNINKKEIKLDDNEIVEIILLLLSHLQKNDEQANKITELISHFKIKIIRNMTEYLFTTEKLKLNELIKYVNNFSEFCIEIQYPSDIFEDIYYQVLEIKKSNPKQVKICIFITGIETTDSYFNGNHDIDYITFDSCVKSIGKEDDEDSCVSSFEGCTSLSYIEIPPTVEFIGPRSFINCSSLSSISIPFRENQIEMSVFERCSSLTKISTQYTVSSIPVPNIDDYEITQLIYTSAKNNDIFKGVNKNTGQTVVIKSLSTSKDFNFQVDFLSGLNISQVDLPGILKIQSFRYPLTNEEKQTCELQKYEADGKTIDLTGYIAISEFLENGRIFEIIEKYLKSKGKENKKMNPTIRSKIIFGISATMKSLHRRKIIHRNLTDFNILLDDKLEPRIGSFSFARYIDEPFKMEMAVGTAISIAPELFIDGYDPYSFPVDVYAYSILLYRMFSCNISFADKKPIRSAQQYLKKISRGDRPVRPSNIPDHYWELIQKCWKEDPEERPTFNEITDILKDDKYALEEFGMKTDLEQLHEYQRRIDIG